MSRRGRPVGSAVRQNIIEILYFLGEGYGYEIYKLYREIFGPINLRNLYYHLKKGVQLGELKKKKIITTEGNYSWGSTAEKTIYSLDANAKPKIINAVKEFLDKKGLTKAETSK